MMAGHHFFKGTYISYASPKLTRKGRTTLLLLSLIEKSVRKAAINMLKNPFRLFRKAHADSVIYSASRFYAERRAEYV